MRITKAVIPAAGLGTRVLPATKNMPKEMYPIVDKPTIQFIVEEAVAAGIQIFSSSQTVAKDLWRIILTLLPNLKVCLKRAAKQNFLKQSEIFQT